LRGANLIRYRNGLPVSSLPKIWWRQLKMMPLPDTRARNIP